MEEKNKIITNYIKYKSNNLNNNYKDLVNEEMINKAIEMYTNREESLEEIEKEIDAKIKELINNYEKMKMFEQEPHYDLNDYFDCRISHNTLHIHVIPKDIKEDIFKMGLKYYDYVEEKLVDALNKIPEILKMEENKDIKSVFAVSPLLRTNNSQELFKKYGFDVGIEKEGEFSDMFDGKKVGLATIPKDKFLEMYDKKSKKI